MSYFYETDSDGEEKKPRKLNKKNCGKPVKRLVAIKNKDKKNHEFWSTSRSKDIGNIPSPARILLLGPPGVGKTNTIKNSILHQRPRFEEVFLVHLDLISQDYADMDITEVFDEIPDLDFWETEEGLPVPKRAIILDDMEFQSSDKERKKRLAILFRYASTHKNLTVYFSHQSTFDCPSIVRKMSDIWILYKPRSLMEMTTVENRVGLNKGTLSQLFNTVASGHRDSICIDLKENSPAKLRLNIWKKIQSDSEEDEEDSTRK